jgi:predicted anti-sigma-YlaC factor YlaD
MRWLSLLLVAATLAGCSVRTLAVNSLADSLAEGGEVYASDEDPELVRDALPFALKTYETLLAEAPDHGGLLLATCSGLTQYANGFIEGDAIYVEEEDWEEAERLRERALKLYLRGRDYCLRALEEIEPGVSVRLQHEPESVVSTLGREQVPLLYWTGASWGSAISVGLHRPELVIDAPAVRALVGRALELQEGWSGGALHEAMISLESLPEAMGGSPARARHHFARAVELSRGLSAGPYLALATGLSISEGDREEFERLLGQALEIDPDENPGSRLANILAQRKAAWLLEHVDDYFLEPFDEEEER